jgi:hypothetical protein
MKLTDKIKIELTEQDKEYIENKDLGDMCRYLDSLRSKTFKVGDVLVKKRKKVRLNWDINDDDEFRVETWEYVKVPHRKTNAKYVVVHVDSSGIPVVKRLSVNGKLTKTIQSLADVDFRSEIFEDDPDYAEAIILDKDAYDPIEYERGGKRKL